jgi:uncharacterized protein (TIGR03435 family)
MRRQTVITFVIAMVPVVTAAQQFLTANAATPIDPNTRFEVASIKPIADSSGPILMRMLPGRFESQVPIGVLVRQALQKADYQMIGAPGWINTERYAIVAKPPDGVAPAAMRVMIANLLRDRFHLETHVETRELPIFNLVIARPDGRLGPNLKVTSPECQAEIAERAAAAQRGDPPPPLPTSFPGPNDPQPCLFLTTPVGIINGTGRTIAQLIPTLADLVARPVLDKTGLTGPYDFRMKYAPEPGRVAGLLGVFGQSAGAPPAPIDPDAPSLSVALQEQLGLKLESARAPVEVVVIDRMEKPTFD